MGLTEQYLSLRKFLSYWYLQWELATAIYMMEPIEKVFIHSVFLSLLGVILYAGLTYLPGHIVMMFHFLIGDHET